MPRPFNVQRQFRIIRQSVAALERALKSMKPGAAAAGRTPTRRLKLSPKRRAQLKLHGRYLGYVRQLKPRQKTKVKAIKASNATRVQLLSATPEPSTAAPIALPIEQLIRVVP